VVHGNTPRWWDGAQSAAWGRGPEPTHVLFNA
jgi:hypothetical protein